MELMQEMTKLESTSSNHEEVIELVIENAINLNKTWASSAWKRKLRIQNLLFPMGLHYNKKNDTVRTTKINQTFLWMACYQKKLEQIKSGIPILNIKYSALVVPPGIEPGTHRFSVCCSTDWAKVPSYSGCKFKRII